MLRLDTNSFIYKDGFGEDLELSKIYGGLIIEQHRKWWHKINPQSTDVNLLCF